jgi:hypothetical protein
MALSMRSVIILRMLNARDVSDGISQALASRV